MRLKPWLHRLALLGLSLTVAACAASKPPLSPAPDPERKKQRDSETIEHGPYALKRTSGLMT